MEVKFDHLYEERVRDLQGRVYFVKTLRASHLPSHTANPRVTLPAPFVQQHCDKIRKSVELQNVATGRSWTVQLAVHNPRNIAQVLFCGRGWRDFATSNGLREGDRLIFVLRGMSAFGVSIFQNAARKAVPGEHIATMERRKTIESTSKTSTDESRGCKFKDTSSKLQKIEKTVGSVSDLVTKKRIAEEKVAGCASEVRVKVPLDSPRSSPIFFKKEITNGGSDICTDRLPPVELSDEHKLRISLERGGSGFTNAINHNVYEHRTHLNSPRSKKPVSHPSFLKLLTTDNLNLRYLEVPCHFAMTWGSELQAHVKLQGIFKGSPERIVACTWGKNETNQMSELFLSDGWREFQAENDLEAGLVLGFTLTADSFFVVRGFHL